MKAKALTMILFPNDLSMYKRNCHLAIMSDFLGKAIYNFHKGKDSDLKISINGSLDDPMDLSLFFRSYKNMNGIEQKAMDMSRGRILDIGAAAGCHTLYLQTQQKDVEALEISDHACKVMEEKGVKKIINKDVFDYHEGSYDTLLLLMNGLGMGTSLKGCKKLLRHLIGMLNDGGQILADSSDIRYMFEVEDGVFEFEMDDKYYGEVVFELEYRGEKDSPFPWVYVAPEALESICDELKLTLEFIHFGEHYDYLAKISK